MLAPKQRRNSHFSRMATASGGGASPPPLHKHSGMPIRATNPNPNPNPNPNLNPNSSERETEGRGSVSLLGSSDMHYEGWLSHKAERGRWKNIYACLEIIELKIYKSETKREELARVLLHKCELSISVTQKKNDKLRSLFRFGITENTGHVHDFAAPTEEDRRHWMQLLEQVLEKALEKESASLNSPNPNNLEASGGDIDIVSCDIFQEDPTFGFLRCSNCKCKQNEHFKFTEVGFAPHETTLDGWLYVKRQGAHRTKLSSDWLQKYGRLKGMVMTYNADPKIADSAMVIPLDLHCHLVRYDQYEGRGLLSTKYLFSISTPKGIFMFATDTVVDRENWLRGLLSSLSYAYLLQEARISACKTLLAEMEGSTSYSMKDVRNQRRKIAQLEERAGVEPTIFNETDVKISKLKRLAERLSQASEEAVMEFIENGGLSKLCNTLRRLCEQAILTEDDIETQKGLVMCFRALMNQPVGMEAVVYDAEPLELMGSSVFLSPSPELWLIQSVSEVFSAVALFSMDGCEVVVRSMRTMDRSYRRMLARRGLSREDSALHEEISNLRPFHALLSLLGDVTITSSAILSLLGLTNVMVSVPRTRNERLRLRAELARGGYEDLLNRIQARATETLSGKLDQSRDSVYSVAPEEFRSKAQRSNSTTGVDFLLSRRLGEAKSNGTQSARPGSQVKDEQAERLRKISQTLTRSFLSESDSGSLGSLGSPINHGLSLAKRAKKSDLTLDDEESECWRQIQKQITVYREGGIQEEDEDVLVFDSSNLTHVMQRIDRLTILRRLEVREQVLTVFNDVLSALNRSGEDDIEIDLGAFMKQGNKFRSALDAAKFYQKKFMNNPDVADYDNKVEENAPKIQRPSFDIQSAVQQALIRSAKSTEGVGDKIEFGGTAAASSEKSGEQISPLDLPAHLTPPRSESAQHETSELTMDKDNASDISGYKQASAPLVVPLTTVQTPDPPLPPPTVVDQIPPSGPALPPNIPAPPAIPSSNGLPPAASVATSSLPPRGMPPPMPGVPLPARGVPPPMPGAPLPPSGMPPPMPGAPFGVNKLHSTYKGIAPTSKTKPLHWEKIPNRIATSTWWKQDQSKVGELPAEDLKAEELERLFSVVEVGVTGKKKGGREQKQETVQILQGARSQNIEITLSRFQMEPAEVKRRLYSGDISGMAETKVELLPLLLPDAEEEKALKLYVDGGGRIEMLSNAERFLCTLADVPRVQSKASVCLLQVSAPKKIHEVRLQIACVLGAVEQVQCSRALRGLLKLVVSIGNFLNYGSSRMCLDDSGIRIKSLEQLQCVKSNDPLYARTLLHYVVRIAQQKCPVVLSLGAELSLVKEASCIDYDQLNDQTKQILLQTKNAKKEVDNPDSQVEDSVKHFISNVSSQVSELGEKIRSIDEQVQVMLTRFGEDPTKTSYSSWFTEISNFIRTFDRAVVDNAEADERRDRQQRLDKEKEERKEKVRLRKERELRDARQRTETFVALPRSTKKGRGGEPVAEPIRTTRGSAIFRRQSFLKSGSKPRMVDSIVAEVKSGSAFDSDADGYTSRGSISRRGTGKTHVTSLSGSGSRTMQEKLAAQAAVVVTTRSLSHARGESSGSSKQAEQAEENSQPSHSAQTSFTMEIEIDQEDTERVPIRPLSKQPSNRFKSGETVAAAPTKSMRSSSPRGEHVPYATKDTRHAAAIERTLPTSMHLSAAFVTVDSGAMDLSSPVRSPGITFEGENPMYESAPLDEELASLSMTTLTTEASDSNSAVAGPVLALNVTEDTGTGVGSELGMGKWIEEEGDFHDTLDELDDVDEVDEEEDTRISDALSRSLFNKNKW